LTVLNLSSGLRIVCPLVGLLLADCATVVAQPSPGGSPPANYRQSVSDSDVASILRDDKPAKSKLKSEQDGATVSADTAALRMRQKGPAALSVSSLRKSVATEQGDWFTCLKAVRGGSVNYYGLSFIGAEIVEWRPAVAIDHCQQQAYGPLPPTTRKPKKDDDEGRLPARKPQQ
jgi:hypothetical protein